MTVIGGADALLLGGGGGSWDDIPNRLAVLTRQIKENPGTVDPGQTPQDNDPQRCNSATNGRGGAPTQRRVSTSLTFNISSGTLTVNVTSNIGSGQRTRTVNSSYTISGQSGRDGTAMNNPNMVGVRNVGPIPPGNYYLLRSEISQWSLPGALARNVRGDWGSFRVPLHPRHGTNTYGRDGFFLHGGSLSGSAGCIDVGGGILGSGDTDRLLNDLNRDSDGRIPLTVTP